jgi:hypothetical protein
MRMRAAYSVNPALQTAGRRAKVPSVSSLAARRNSTLFRLFRATLRHVAIPLVAGSVAAFACGGDDAPPGIPNDDTPPIDASVFDVAPVADTGPRDSGPVDAGGTCLDELRARGIAFKSTTARGVVDAVNVTSTINDVLYANQTATTPSTDPMSCRFVLALWDLAEVLKNHNIHRVGTLGSYCYRCCCSWSQTNFCRGVNDPEPSCGGNGYSNHSWGRAIDLRYFYLDNGTRFDVNDPKHWVISSKTTCGAAQVEQVGTSAAMYDIACAIGAAKIFSQVLTPNWNDAHRNHFHIDIGSKGEPSGFAVRSLATSVDPPSTGIDACGDE